MPQNPQPAIDQSTLHLAHCEFVNVLCTLTESDHQLPSPCPPWTVGDVVDHLVGGAIMAAALLGGNASVDALAIRDTWTRNRPTAPHALTALDLERAAFESVDPAERVDHPVLPMSASDLLGQRIIEYAVHTWDIRQAIDDPTPLDATLARRAWQVAAPLAPFVAGLKVFGSGPSGLLGDGADDESRLVDLTGRRIDAPHADRVGTVAR